MSLLAELDVERAKRHNIERERDALRAERDRLRAALTAFYAEHGKSVLVSARTLALVEAALALPPPESAPAVDEAKAAPRMFPIHSEDRREVGLPYAIEWAFVAPHEQQAKANHGQTLERLAERGGLGWDELFAVVRGLTLRGLRMERKTTAEFREAVLADFEKWKAAPPQPDASGAKRLLPTAQQLADLEGDAGGILAVPGPDAAQRSGDSGGFASGAKDEACGETCAAVVSGKRTAPCAYACEREAGGIARGGR